MAHRPELKAFNRLVTGTLAIELSEKPVQISPGLRDSLKAPPDALIQKLSFKAEVFENDDFRELTDLELDLLAFDGPSIELRAEDGEFVACDAPNGKHFTVRDLIAAVEKTELVLRGRSKWFGGIDVHHIFFEGIHPTDDGRWWISWGS